MARKAASPSGRLHPSPAAAHTPASLLGTISMAAAAVGGDGEQAPGSQLGPVATGGAPGASLDPQLWTSSTEPTRAAQRPYLARRNRVSTRCPTSTLIGSALTPRPARSRPS